MFVENRYVTWIFEALVPILSRLGHDIHWLVQNPVFGPRTGTVHQLPFPDRASLNSHRDDATYDWLIRTDRSARHFEAGTAHYAHYDKYVRAAISRAAPDVVFGEPTGFHELLAINHCRISGIPFLSPNATRFPPDRVTFFAYDTQDPVGGSGETLADTAARQLLDDIRCRRVVTGHTPIHSMSLSRRVTRSIAERVRVTAGWLAGERYITPSPVRKFQLELALRRFRSQWDDLAKQHESRSRALLDTRTSWLLYAMQMQPESNIDVWGRPWNDQTFIIERAARSLAGLGCSLVVKPNPHSKYELTAGLLDVVRRSPNIVVLPHQATIGPILASAPGVLSVTGTILLESIFIGKPTFCLGTHTMSTYPGITPIRHPDDICMAAEAALQGQGAAPPDDAAIGLLKHLYSTSYGARFWDPLSRPREGIPSETTALASAFTQVLAQIRASQGP